MPESFDVLLSRWRAASKQVETLVKDTPRIVGTECTKIVKDNFKLQGYDNGYGVKAWPARKASTDKEYDARRVKGKQGTYKGSVYSSSNPLLLQTRNLYNSIKYKAISKSVIIGVDLLLIPYAEAMNDTRKYSPKPTEPPNPKMLKAMKKKISYQRDKIMKDFKK